MPRLQLWLDIVSDDDIYGCEIKSGRVEVFGSGEWSEWWYVRRKLVAGLGKKESRSSSEGESLTSKEPAVGRCKGSFCVLHTGTSRMRSRHWE